jgi:uncharacterized protein YeaC (DUF1315 family)
MYCLNCNKEYNGKFCPECGTKLIDRPADGINVSLGDANAISGGVHISDSHNVHNVDKSVHNITNVNTTVNNITKVAAQKTEMEIIQERKLLFLNACRRACEDMTIDQDDVNKLDEYRLEIGLDEKTANEIIQNVKDTAVKSIVKTELDALSKVLLKQFNANLKRNRVTALEKQLEYVEAMAKKYANEEVQYKFYLALATLRSEQCVKRYEDLQGENYWQTFWSYFAYLKEGKSQEAESLLIDMDKYVSYPTDNTIALGGAGELVKGNDDEAQAYLGEMTGDYTPMLQRFVESIFLVSGLKTEDDLGGEADDCYYYLAHLYGREPQSQIEQQNKAVAQTKIVEAPVVSYYVAMNGQPYGPCDMTQLSKLKEQLTLTPDTYVWHEGMQNWEFAKDREDLEPLFAPKPAVQTVAPKPKAEASGKHQINKPEEEPVGNFIAGIEIPSEWLDHIILEGSYEFKKFAQKEWGLSFNEANALYRKCRDYYEEHGKWPDGHVTAKKDIDVSAVPRQWQDNIILEGSYEFKKFAQKEWGLSFNEANDLYRKCRDYYEEHGKWPDGHVTAKKDIDVSAVPRQWQDNIILEGSYEFKKFAQKEWGLSFNEANDLYRKCRDYYEKHGKWPDGHVTDFKIK